MKAARPAHRDERRPVYKDYTQFLSKDALKGVRLGVIRDFAGTDAEVDRVFDATLAELKAQGAVLVDPVNFPAIALQNRAVVMDPIRRNPTRSRQPELIDPYTPTSSSARR